MNPFSPTRRIGQAMLVLLAVWTAGCGRQEQSLPVEEIVRPDLPDQESWDVVLSLSQEGRPRMRIEADYMARYEREDSLYTVLEGTAASSLVSAQFYDQAGEKSATLRAERIVYDEERRKMEARGKVRVLTETGRELESEHLIWEEASRKIRTPGFVRINTPTRRVQGYQLVADEDLQTYFLSRITGQVTVEE